MRTTGRIFFISGPPTQPLGTAWQEQTSAGDNLRWQPTYRPILHRAALGAKLLPTQTATRKSLSWKITKSPHAKPASGARGGGQQTENIGGVMSGEKKGSYTLRAAPGRRMERKWRRREKNLFAMVMSRAICVRNSAGPVNFFSSRRRFQKRTSMRLGVLVP